MVASSIGSVLASLVVSLSALLAMDVLVETARSRCGTGLMEVWAFNLVVGISLLLLGRKLGLVPYSDTWRPVPRLAWIVALTLWASSWGIVIIPTFLSLFLAG